jgi:hypothetical protein
MLFNDNADKTYTLGEGLGSPNNAEFVRLQAPAPPGGLTLTLTVAAPNVALLAQNNETNGTRSLTLPISEGGTLARFRIIGVAEGDTIVTANAPGYLSTTAPIAIQPAGLAISGLNRTYTAGTTDSSVSVLSYYLNELGVIQSPQPVMRDTTVTLTSSDPNVGTVTASITISANTNSSGNTAVFEALTIGTTTVTASTPNFSPSNSDQVTITIE